MSVDRKELLAASENHLVKLDYRPERDTRKLKEFIQTHGTSLTVWSIAVMSVTSLFWFLALLGQGGAGPVNTNGFAILCTVLMPFTLWASVRLAKIFLQPTHLLLDYQSVWTESQQLGAKRKKLFDWNELVRISVISAPGKTKKEDQLVVFETQSGRQAKVKLGGLQTATSRPILLEYIRSQASDVPRSPELMPLLERPQDHSYTELWLSALSAPPKLEYVTPLSQGRQLKNGKYTIQKKLGSGGQGSAYLAVNKDSPGEIEANQLVVLKEYVLPVQVSRASRRQSLQALENETRILEKLSHAQIVSLIDYFVEDHRGYLVLEHIDGVTLRACVNEQGPMPEARVRELAVQLCDILNYLHKQTPPVVHRDFTPDNLILTNSGLVKLIDFNVAQQTSEPVTGTVVGKHAYLPPEQFRGKAVSGSDIYALGAMLSFLLTAEEPEPLSVSHPRALNRNVSEGLDLIISNATQLDSAARPTATELLKAISKL